MKKRNGFTLIELLAVIVILAIIALIAVPIILNVIEKSKESSAVDSAYGYIHAIEEAVVEAEVKNGLLAENTEYSNLREFENTYDVGIKGNKPTSGLFRLEKRQVVYAEFMVDGYSIVCDKKKCESKGKGAIITITYNLDGGTLNKSDDKLTKGSTIELPVPTKEHYGFDGWYTEGNERVNNETIFNENTTLTAHWTKNRYTVIFDAGEGGTSTESSLSVDSGDTLNLPSAERVGYTFNGWFTEREGGEEVTNSTPILGSQTLYAHYTINTYVIIYNSNGGSEVSPSSVTVQHGQTLTLPEPTKEGFVLEGWYTESENGTEITNETSITSSQTLYAHYVSAVTNFSYTGAVQTLTLQPGRYKLEVWGAQGGDYNSVGNTSYKGYGSWGGYSYGTISISNAEDIYIYVGGQGSGSNNSTAKGGFNGGGNGLGRSDGWGAGGGGGGTDIRIGTNSLYARVIVAGGGAGGGHGNYNTYRAIGWGGGTNGGYGHQSSSGIGVAGTTSQSSGTQPGTQTSGYSFGNGGNATTEIGGGGGGGWYGGSGGGSCQDGGGGSGYVYTSSTASNYPSGCLLNSSYYLTDAQTIAGNTSFLSPSGTNETGHAGNGYARITYLGSV